MSSVKIITDSNSGILQKEAEELGIIVVPMPFYINEDEYFEELTISQQKFYELLKTDPSINTSQPSPGALLDLWDEQLKTYDQIVYIPMSSGLSSSCSNAINLAKDYNGKVQVVDNSRISVTLRESVYEAIKLAKANKTAEEIKSYLEQTKKISSIYIMLDTLKYLKRGGRISPAAAALGSMLKIKPILTSRGGKFEKFAMALTPAQGKRKIIVQLKKDLETDFAKEYADGKMVVSVAHTNNEVEANKFKEEILKEFPNLTFNFVNPLSLSVSCHIGPGAIAAALSINNYLK